MRLEIQGEWAGRTAKTRARWRILAMTMALLGCLAGFGCLGAGRDAAEDPANWDAARRMARIEELRRAIAQDHQTLEDLITKPGQAADASLHGDPELRSIAIRLTDQERELEDLKSLVDGETAPSK